jgi:hypothetical protein
MTYGPGAPRRDLGYRRPMNDEAVVSMELRDVRVIPAAVAEAV